jgi:uncharacterized membrane protein
MKALRSSFARVEIVGEIVAFLWRRKLWWLIPMVLVLMMFGLLMIFATVTGVGPFIYTLF